MARVRISQEDPPTAAGLAALERDELLLLEGDDGHPCQEPNVKPVGG